MALSAGDALSSGIFMSKIGTTYELNPLVASVWTDSGPIGLLSFKLAMAGFFGLILAILATREALAAIVGLSSLTLWAIVANLSITPTSGTVALMLFNPLTFAGLSLTVSLVFWEAVYPRIMERRQNPRPIEHPVTG